MRLFRICTTEVPTDWDLQSHEARGKSPPRSAPASVIRDWSRLSVYTTRAMAEDKAREIVRLGSWVAELEVPAEVRMFRSKPTPAGQHVSLVGTNPDQLRRYIVAIRPVPDKSRARLD
jgi:hypothetical protein